MSNVKGPGANILVHRKICFCPTNDTNVQQIIWTKTNYIFFLLAGSHFELFGGKCKLFFLFSACITLDIFHIFSSSFGTSLQFVCFV